MNKKKFFSKIKLILLSSFNFHKLDINIIKNEDDKISFLKISKIFIFFFYFFNNNIFQTKFVHYKKNFFLNSLFIFIKINSI
jgi:hypothetical protein